MFSLRTILFDAFQVDRLVVLPAWRGVGAKELLLALGGGAFHRLGLPCRIKTVREQCNRLLVPALSIIKKTIAKCKFFRSCRSELVSYPSACVFALLAALSFRPSGVARRPRGVSGEPAARVRGPPASRPVRHGPRREGRLGALV